MTAKMKSLSAAGSQPHLSRPSPSPTPNQPPLSIAYRAWMPW